MTLLPYLMWSFFPRASFKMVVSYAGWDSGERGCWLLGGATVMMTVFIHTAENEIFLMFCWKRDAVYGWNFFMIIYNIILKHIFSEDFMNVSFY
jgi:hypothetical protein